jgi:hypothetical protein
MAYTYGVTGGLGTYAGWAIQNTTTSISKSVQRVLNGVGTEAAINATNRTEETSATYNCTSNTNTVPDTIGKDVDTDKVLTEIAFTLNADNSADMQLTAHRHLDGTPPAVTGLKQVAHGLTVTQAFGIPTEPISGATTENGGTDWTSVSIRISCQHSEAMGSNGTVVAHENYDAVVEVTLNALSAITAPTGYTVTSQTDPTEGNTDFQTYSVTCQKKLTLATPAP